MIAAILRAVVFLHAHGYDVPLEYPTVRVVDTYPNAAQLYKGEIQIDDGRPEECLESDVAHEMVHWYLGKFYGMSWKQSEPLARALDDEINADPYRPNCGLHK